MGGILCSPVVPAVPIVLVHPVGYLRHAMVRGGAATLDQMDVYQRAWLIERVAANENVYARRVVDWLREQKNWDSVCKAAEAKIQFFRPGEQPAVIYPALRYEIRPLTDFELARAGVHSGHMD